MKIEELKTGMVLVTKKNVFITEFNLYEKDGVPMVELYYKEDMDGTTQIWIKTPVEEFEKEFEFGASPENHIKTRKTYFLKKEYFTKRYNTEQRCRAIKTTGSRCTYNIRGGDTSLFCGSHMGWDKKPNRKFIDTCRHTHQEIEYYALIRAKQEVHGIVNINEDELKIIICPTCDMKYVEAIKK